MKERPTELICYDDLTEWEQDQTHQDKYDRNGEQRYVRAFDRLWWFSSDAMENDLERPTEDGFWAMWLCKEQWRWLWASTDEWTKLWTWMESRRLS